MYKEVLKYFSGLLKPKTTNVQKKDLFEFYNFVQFGKNEANLSSDYFDKITLLWFIPDVGIGSGGHLNIFRMISNLTKLGIKSDLVICGHTQWQTKERVKEVICDNFYDLESNVKIVNNTCDLDLLGEYNIAIASSWQTAYFVNYYGNCAKKAYFVQDYEPYFFPYGSNYALAENTYKFNFYGITAGSWLSTKLKKEYSMDCQSFSFSYDRELYFVNERREEKRRVFFYARPPTDRRAFELGMLALNSLYKKNPDIEIILAGWDTSDYMVPFPHFNPGVVALKELSHLYSQCDVALVLSFTNLSLLPLELLASGCPVVCNVGENNSWIDKDKKLFVYSENNVFDISDNLDNVLNRKVIPDYKFIDSFLSSTSWDEEALKVKNILHYIDQNL